MTLSDWQKEVTECARSKGWMEKKVEVPEQVALICSEAIEAFESWRNREPLSFIDTDGKPQGIGSEYADIVIRVMHYSSLLGIDLEAEIIKKTAYNRTRPYRHGNKRA